MSKATGKYYAKVYHPKKTLASIRHARVIKRTVLAVVAAALVITGIVTWQISRADDSAFVEVAASSRSLSGVKEYPRIVSTGRPMDKNYEPQNLESLNTVPNGENICLRGDAAESFRNMLSAMAEDGMAVIPVRGYASYDDQKKLLDDSVYKFIAEGYPSDEAEALAARSVFTPGSDEAQLGTSVDVATDVNAVESFGVTDQYQWICANAHRFGFIVRYTADKQDITGVEAKPWHLRYVGTQAAEYMKYTGCCMEEYVSLIQKTFPDAVEEN